jgi:hypothetical protein
MILRLVTLQEANMLLPLVREHFFRIQVMLTRLKELREYQNKKVTDRFVFDSRAKEITIVKKKYPNKRMRASQKESTKLEERIEKELNELIKLGAVIRGFMPPHIDFLSMRNHEIVFLCWHGGEPEIKHWHSIDEGFTLRQMIAHHSPFGPHLVH